jgi:hypothetical protein
MSNQLTVSTSEGGAALRSCRAAFRGVALFSVIAGRIRPLLALSRGFDELDYIDHVCLDLLVNWGEQHQATGGTLVIEWDELSWKYHQRHQRQLASLTSEKPAVAVNSNEPAAALSA